MRNLDYEIAIVKGQLDSMGIAYDNNAPITANTRAYRRWGQTKRIGNKFAINVNADLLREENDENGLRGTIAHELIHTVPGCFNHGDKWSKLAEYVKEKTGWCTDRVSTAEEMGVVIHTKPTHKTGYVVKCKECGKIVGRYFRAGNVVKYPSLYIHGGCGGKLEVERVAF